jgi:hypothetical protein
MKVSPELSRRAEPAALDRGPVGLRVVVHAGESETRARRSLSGLQVTAAPAGHRGAWRLHAEVPPERLGATLARLAALPEVEAVEPMRPMRLLNQDAVWVHQSFVGPASQQTPLFDRGIYGCGQVIALADSGQDYGACHFQDPNGPPPVALCTTPPCPAAAPAAGRRKDILYYNWSGTTTGDDDTCPATFGGSGHGTHTSGSAAGDRSPYADCGGFTSPSRNAGDGQAPGAKLVMQEMGDGLEYLNSFGGTLWNLADVAYQTGARIASFSWGGGCQDLFGCVPGCELAYDSFARDADLAMWTYPDLLITTSAGNSGGVCLPPSAVTTPAVAKNVVSVGALGHGTAAVTPSSFSSQGPTFDGRLKPTLAAQGESVVSAASDASGASANCSTCTLEGTSMAAPTVAGLAALVREFFTAGFHASGTRSPGAGMVPSGSLLKAILIDGAVGTAAPAEADFDSGFGRVLLSGTLPFPGSGFALRVDDHREGLLTGEVVTRAWDVSAGVPLRVTLVWTDHPAALNSPQARVNSLRLELTDPAGVTWFQTIDGATGLPRQTSDPQAVPDTLNVENRIVFESPAAGRWIARVIGVDVPMGPQPFALVARGALTDCPAPASPGVPALQSPAPNQVEVSWNAVPGTVHYRVQHSQSACPGGPWHTIAPAVPGTAALHAPVAGGTPSSYRVVAAGGASGECESAPSTCASIVPPGDCWLPPRFAGARAARSVDSSGCAVRISWEAASPVCGSTVVYNVYRDTTAGFVPSPASRIARCVNGTTFEDAASLAPGVVHHYKVRAEDATTGHEGPCGGGNEDDNVQEVSAAAWGPPVLGTFQDDAGDTGVASFGGDASWSVQPAGGNAAPRSYVGASSAGICSALVSPVLTLADPGLGPGLEFSTVHDLEYDPIGVFGAEGSLGQVEIATGPSFNDWTRVPLTPDYPAVMEFPLNGCATTAAPETYFGGSSFTHTMYAASLANWGGGDVKLRFLLSGDYIYPGGTWTLDDVRVTQALVPGACASIGAGPPPLPDGASVPGQPLQVQRSGADLLLTWGSPPCSVPAVNVYWGHLGSFGSFAGGVCGLPATGTATVSLPDDVWFLVAATNGTDTDGSWSRDGSGAELDYAGAGTACPSMLHHVANGACP